MAEGYQCEIGLLPSKASYTMRLIGRPSIVTWFALRKLRPNFLIFRETGCSSSYSRVMPAAPANRHRRQTMLETA
jgi:hypothetical protein